MSRVGVGKTFRKVTHAIFDMDGLLLDTETMCTKMTKEILAECGHTLTWEAKNTEGAYYRVISSVLASHGKVYTPELRNKVLGMQAVDTCKTLVSETKLPIKWQEFHAQFQPALFKLVQNTSLLPGVERLIKHLYNNNVPCAVATSSSASSFAVKSQCHKDFFSMFRHIVTGGSDPEVKHGKPAPDIFKLAADRFADRPKYEDCLVFEDAPNGVLGGRAAGMQVVMIPDEHATPEYYKNATLVLKSMLEFEPELFGLPEFPNKTSC